MANRITIWPTNAGDARFQGHEHSSDGNITTSNTLSTHVIHEVQAPKRALKSDRAESRATAKNPFRIYESIIKDDPKNHYEPLAKILLKEKITLARSIADPGVSVVARKHDIQIRQDRVECFVNRRHPNIQQLLQVFEHENCSYSFYSAEPLEFSLHEVNSCFNVFDEPQVATIGHESLKGIDFMHTVLRFVHGSIDDRSIIISISGNIKIGNLPLNKASITVGTPTYSEDINALHQCLLFLVGGEAAVRHLSPQAQNFFQIMTHTSSATLLEATFLKNSSSPATLFHITQRTALALPRDWELCDRFE